MVSSPDENSPECPVADHESVLRLGLDTAATGISFERLKSSQKSTVESPLASETSNKVIVTEKAAEHEDNYPLYKRLDISSSSSTVTSENGADTVEMLRSSGKRVLVTEEEDCRVPRTSNQGKSRDEINESCLKENGGSCGNGVANCTTKLKRENSVECLDNDEVDNEPPLKKKKDEQKSPIPDDPEIEITSVVKPPEKRSELTSSEALLDKLDEYVKHAIESGISVERKILDALLGAINIQVQREPLSVRKLILDKQLVLPNTISFPPSQVVDLLIEHDPDAPLAKVITKMFGDERPKLTEAEKRDRHLLKLTHPAPHMTKLLMDIGQDLVQESTYSDIVHAKNLPETPKNMETYKQVAQQLKPVWEALRKKNESYKLKQHGCQLCAFKTESRLVLAHHRQTPHFDGRKYTCALCPEYFTNEHMIAQHYLKRHGLIAGKDEQPPRNPCPCCNEDFVYKGQRDQHLKICRKDLNRVRLIMAPRAPSDVSAINQWLWEKPPVDPTILQQQQAAQRQQAERQQRAQLAQQQAAQQRRQAAQNSALLAAQQHQTLLFQQRMRAAQVAVLNTHSQAKMNPLLNNPSLLAAMQQQLQRVAAAGIRTPGLPAFSRALNNSLSRTPALGMTQLGGRARSSPQLYSSRVPCGSTSMAMPSNANLCEICDQNVQDRDRYLNHLQLFHKQMRGKTSSDMQQGAPLACSRCRDRFWTYEGLERHLVMAHGLVTSDLLTKAQKKEDGGRCKLCGKQYAFNMLQHLVTDHAVKLCSAEIMYSCDVCSFKCSSYNKLEVHLNTVHPKNPPPSNVANTSTVCPSSSLII